MLAMPCATATVPGWDAGAGLGCALGAALPAAAAGAAAAGVAAAAVGAVGAGVSGMRRFAATRRGLGPPGLEGGMGTM